MEKIIVPTGYMGSGSSAVTDILSEFSDCNTKYSCFEYIFLHCPNGLFDLEDHLLIGNNALKSDYSIRVFKEQMYKLYSKPFWWVGNYKKIIGKNFKAITDKYIKSITQYNFNNYWYMHEEVNFNMFLKLVIRKPLKIITKNKCFNSPILRYKDGMFLTYIDKNEFYNKSKNYIYSVLNEICDKKENIVLDQLVLPYNLFRIDNYFNDDLKVIVVDRDPRDVFISNKYFWSTKKSGVPFSYDAKEFSTMYKQMRKSEKITNSKKILRIHFEDLIYNYEDTLKKICDFTSLNEKNHVMKLKKFNYNVSIRNTQIFRDKKYTKEIDIIEKELKEYLYDFPYILNNDIKNSIEFDINGNEI